MGPAAFNSHTVTLTGGATLQFVVPISAQEAAPKTLPEFQVSGLPGARVALRRGFIDAGGASVHVACVEAPSDRWAPGMEDIVFGVANGVAHRAMSQQLTLETWEPGALVSRDEHFEQKVFGKGLRESSSVKLSGQHVLGFEGAKRDVVLCSVICDEAPERAICAEIVSRAKLEGLVAAPAPSVLVQAVFYAAEKPWNAAAFVGVLGMMMVGLVLAKRPRPKP